MLYGTSKPVQKWSVDSVHSKNVVAILHLLVALARHFRAPIRLPENVSVNVVVVKKDGSNQLSHRYIKKQYIFVFCIDLQCHLSLG